MPELLAVPSQKGGSFDGTVVQNFTPLTLTYPTHLEDVQCQSRVYHIYEG